MGIDMTLNTRAKRREDVNAPVEYAIRDSTGISVKLNIPPSSVESKSGEVHFIKSALIDIGALGCAIDSQYLIPPGVILDIKINRLPFLLAKREGKEDPMSMLGKVRSCVMRSQGHYRLGIFFTKAEKKDIDLIEKFIESKERRKTPRWDMTK